MSYQQRSIPMPINPAHEFYDTVIEKVMSRMEERLKAHGFDVEQIDTFKRLWKSQCEELENQSDDETEEAQYQQPLDQYGSNDLYTQHVHTLQNQQFSIAHPQHSFPLLSGDRATNDPYHSSFVQQEEKPIMPMTIPETIIQHPVATIPPVIENAESVGDDDDSGSLSDDESSEEQENDSVMICLFTSVKHSHSRHRCDFINCVLRFRHREYFFTKCLGEFQSA
ncbi:hypothetical protein EDI_013540 [Entamoeba dispar SAW760]|uniref:Uncharacterized protein n=1 Tax=Entamoeba dispar (strain ATCC PRA-260 / SAW760) TaxID=370354 RepID=B0E5P8_ENTDS|nr:uncharacterized protein EDI_013540 [Entamoeba dispar SAW760]EDR30144.1 hypothetical protein EDI_013540 [Entamoeba dispar SAW760]|eukprot:EDR30144.1 hypothetical protein EDI_013540 [Entamoeba dispar SAW760]